MEVLLIVNIACALGGWFIGERKGQPLGGFLMGLLLGVLGLLIVAVFPAKKPDVLSRAGKGEKRCPDCAEWVQSGAFVCRYCGARPAAWATTASD